MNWLSSNWLWIALAAAVVWAFVRRRPRNAHAGPDMHGGYGASPNDVEGAPSQRMDQGAPPEQRTPDRRARGRSGCC